MLNQIEDIKSTQNYITHMLEMKIYFLEPTPISQEILLDQWNKLLQ